MSAGAPAGESPLRWLRAQAIAHPCAGAALLSLLLSLALLVSRQFAPFGDQTFLFEDMKRQYVAFYAHYRACLLGPEDFLYSLRKGLGGGMLGFYAYYLASPLLLPLALLPVESYPEAISLLLAVKTALAAASCASFLAEEEPPRTLAEALLTAVCAISFAWSSWFVGNLSNAMWLDAVILLPLLLGRAGRLMDGGSDGTGLLRQVLSHGLLVGAVLYVNYYIAYMILLFEVLWVLAALRRGSLRRAPAWIASLFLGAGLSAALWLPTWFSLGGTAKNSLALGLRSAGPAPGLLQILSRLYSMSYDTTQIMEGAPALSVGAALLVPAVLCFAARDRRLGEKLRLLLLLGALLVSFRSPLLDLLWHAGTAPYGYPFRYAFLFAFLLVLSAHRGLRSLCRGQVGAVGGLACGVGLALVTAAVFRGRYSYLDGARKQWNICLLATSAVLLMALWLFGRRERLRRLAWIGAAAFCLLQCRDLLGNASLICAQIGMFPMAASEFRARYREAWAAAGSVSRDGRDILRMESRTPIEQNDAMLIGYEGVTYYGSDASLRDRRFLQRLGYNDNALYAEYAPGNTRAAEALLGIRYLLDGSLAEAREALPMAIGLRAGGEETEGEAGDPFRFVQTLLSSLLGREAELFARPEVQSREEVQEDGGIRYEFLLRPDGEGEVYFYLSGTEGGQNLLVDRGAEGLLPYGNSASLRVLPVGYGRPGEELRFVLTAYEKPLEGTPLFVTERPAVLEEVLGEIGERGGALREIRSSRLRAEVPAGSREALLLLPYDDAWRVALSGRELETRPWAGMYLVAEIPEGATGTLELQLRYVPRGWYAGILISVISAGICLACRRIESKINVR